MEGEQNAPVQAPESKGKGIWSLIILIIILALAYFAYGKWGNSEVTEEGTDAGEVSNSMPVPGNENVPEMIVEGTTKTFTVVGKPFSFSLSEIKVKQGDTVKIVFQNTEGMHDWVIDEFGARTPQIQAGQSATVEFVANKKGTFEYYCSVGQHRQL